MGVSTSNLQQKYLSNILLAVLSKKVTFLNLRVVKVGLGKLYESLVLLMPSSPLLFAPHEYN
jgi:hypothetical protein